MKCLTVIMFLRFSYIKAKEICIMKKSVCYIIGAGDAYEKEISVNENDCIICADAGLKNANIFSRKPDFVVGDFDSYGSIPANENVVIYPPEKDYSDMLLAIKKGFEEGYDTFVILGALGGDRPEHTIANIQNVSYICNNGGEVYILDNDNVYLGIKNKTVVFDENCQGYVSVFSLNDESRGVTEENLKYTLDDAVMTSSGSIGLSNEFVGKSAKISVKNGVLLIIWKGSMSDCVIE